MGKNANRTTDYFRGLGIIGRRPRPHIKRNRAAGNHNQRITGCRVKVIAPSHKHRHGIGFQVHIWLTVPPHENIVVNHIDTDDARNEHAQVAIKDAFAAARRQVDALAA
jgi:hypothetical protein